MLSRRPPPPPPNIHFLIEGETWRNCHRSKNLTDRKIWTYQMWSLFVAQKGSSWEGIGFMWLVQWQWVVLWNQWNASNGSAYRKRNSTVIRKPQRFQLSPKYVHMLCWGHCLSSNVLQRSYLKKRQQRFSAVAIFWKGHGLGLGLGVYRGFV